MAMDIHRHTVREVFGEIPYMTAQRDAGDFHAADSLVDVEYALRAAGLTPKQRKALELRYTYDMEFSEIGAAMGVTKQAAHRTITRAEMKLAEVFEEWKRKDGETA